MTTKNIEKTSPEKGELLKGLFQTFVNGMNSGKTVGPREFLDSIGLDHQLLHLGFNSGQFHHRRDEAFKAPYIELGVLTKSDAPVNASDLSAYTIFGSHAIIFPLKDESDAITNLCAYRLRSPKPKDEYLNDEGVYPDFPSKRTTRLFLCGTAIDAASLIQSKAMENRDAVIALREGELTEDIRKAIRSLPELDQVIVIAKSAKENLLQELQQISAAQVTVSVMPDGDSLNDMWLKYGTDGILQFIDEVKTEGNDSASFFQVSDREFFYKGEEVSYHIHGVVSQNATLMEFDFEIENDSDGDVLNERIDLLDSAQTSETLYFWTENKHLNCNKMFLELEEIKKQLETVRREQGKLRRSDKRGFSVKADKLAKHLLRSEDLFTELDALIEQAGVIGENKSRLLLYLIASSYRFRYNLHAVIHSSDINSGSELALKIAELIPENDRYFIDLTSSRSFRYYGNSAIDNKFLVIPDYSGVTSNNSISDLKRLQSRGNIVNDAPVKGADGFLNTVKQEVRGHTSSLGACTNTKRFFEGEPRTVLVGMDNSAEQMQRLMNYDCMLMSGDVNEKKIEEAREVLRYVIRNLAPLHVVNPHSGALMLPSNVRNARMLSMQLHQFVSLITLFSQHQREKDADGRVIATKEDIRKGTDLFLDAIMLNIDDLDAGTREFFDKMKTIMLSMPEKREAVLSSFDIQKATGISKSHANRFLKTLVAHEYIKKEGHRNVGFTYRVTNWDELDPVREMIRSQLGGFGEPNTDGSPHAP